MSVARTQTRGVDVDSQPSLIHRWMGRLVHCVTVGIRALVKLVDALWRWLNEHVFAYLPFSSYESDLQQLQRWIMTLLDNRHPREICGKFKGLSSSLQQRIHEEVSMRLLDRGGGIYPHSKQGKPHFPTDKVTDSESMITNADTDDKKTFLLGVCLDLSDIFEKGVSS